jgi:hypothetical protein
MKLNGLLMTCLCKHSNPFPPSALEGLYPREDQVSTTEEAGWTSGPVWTVTENLAHTGIRSQNHPARSEPLYRLSYPAREKLKQKQHFFFAGNFFVQ